MVDFPGHVAAVFFTSDCNFRCGFCHNAALLGTGRPGIPWGRIRSACREFMRNWADAAVVTGGEPTLDDGLPDLLRYFRGECGWSVKLDTNGSRPDRLEECLPLVDYVAMDIKAGLSRYGELTGFGDVAVIHRSVRLIMERCPDYEFRTTALEGFHDTSQMDEIAELITGAKRYFVQPFVPRGHLPGAAWRAAPRTSDEFIKQFIGRVAGRAGEVRVRGAA
jgi:pyruvate formate lyase activating enzyme